MECESCSLSYKCWRLDRCPYEIEELEEVEFCGPPEEEIYISSFEGAIPDFMMF